MKTLSILTTLFTVFILTGIASELTAQCPKSTIPGIHIVQNGENLYRLSKAYGVTVADICAWNNIKSTEKIPVCKSIYVANPQMVNLQSAEGSTIAATYNAAAVPNPSPIVIASGARTDGTHVLQQGQTIGMVANIYGYSEERFRQMNNLPAQLEPVAGSVLTTNDCSCQKMVWVSKSAVTADASVSPLVYQYAQSPAEVTGMSYTPVQHNALPVENNDAYRRDFPVERYPSAPSTESTLAVYHLEVQNATYMSVEERLMADEINLLRSNPAGYATFVEMHLAELNRSPVGKQSAILAAQEAINELKQTSPIPLLKPAQCMYDAAMRHGRDLWAHGQIGHIGSDGSWPWDRITQSCTILQNGNENLVCDITSPRTAVISLLLDDGVQSRGHRINLLDPQWQYMAVHKVPGIGKAMNCWIQEFAY